MKLLSVNVGQPRENPWKAIKLTGIDKRPVDGPVMVTPPRAKGMGMVGLAGDRVYDVREHGGPDQAVYAYAREDLDFWAAELDRPLPNGVFGENLTTEGLDCNGALIGERWRIGPAVVLEASGPRIPCGTFQGWLAQAGWIKRFALAGRDKSRRRQCSDLDGRRRSGPERQAAPRSDGSGCQKNLNRERRPRRRWQASPVQSVDGPSRFGPRSERNYRRAGHAHHRSNRFRDRREGGQRQQRRPPRKTTAAC